MTEQFLKAFRNKYLEVRQLERELAAMGPVPRVSQFDKILAESDSEGSQVEQAVEKFLIIRERYEAILNEYIDDKVRIERAFAECLTPNERTAMRYYYFQRLKWEDTAERMDISTRQALRLRKFALEKLENY